MLDAIDALIVGAVALHSCVGALATAQGSGVSCADPVLAYEKLAGTYGASLRLAWVRAHARAPAWRVLIPEPARAGLAPRSPEGVLATRVRAGVLLGLEVADPFSMGDTEPLERHMLPALGSEAELEVMREGEWRDGGR